MMKIKQIILIFMMLALDCRILSAMDFGNHNKVFVPNESISPADWSNPLELKRTWDYALVRIPTGDQKFIKAYMHELDHSAEKKFPTVIYLHGCSGVWKGTHIRLNFLAKAGFAVIAPQSFARKKYTQSCDPANNLGGIYRNILPIRQNDARYALEHAKSLPWVDAGNLFLMGLSEGAITTATLQLDDIVLSARVIEGWTCHAAWQEYSGLNASIKEPVLSMVGLMDPWYQAPYLQGACGEFMTKKNNRSRSIVYKEDPLKYQHELLEDVAVQKTVVDFLRRHIQ
jgi:dienelactone hydrolase